MRAFVDGEEINPDDVALDVVRWEGGSAPRADLLLPPREGVLLVELDERDLRDLGRKLHVAWRGYLAEDRAYFEGLEDVPQPTSEDLFVKKPQALERYLASGSFWRRKSAEALCAVMNPYRAGTSRWFLQDFDGMRVDPEGVVLQFSVRG